MDLPIRTPSQLSSLLKSARAQRRLTQRAAAAKVGLRQKTISLIESDIARSTVGSLFRLLSALDLELVLRDKSGAPSKPGTEW